jgi:phosphopantetheinyl transferase
VSAAPAVCAGLTWRTRWIGDAPTVDDWASLSEPDAARAAGCTHPAAMTRFVATRGLLRATVVERRPELARTSVVFEVMPTGRLEVAGHPDLAVSSSHTRSFAVAAAADDGPVGIDVEPLDRAELPRPAAWLTPQELDSLAHLEARAPHETDLHRLMLLHLWVAKEAALKAWPGPGSTGRRRIRISCSERRRADTGVVVPSDAAWCGTGEAAVEPDVVEPIADARGGASQTGRALLRIGIAWYAIADAYLVALAHGRRPVGRGLREDTGG